MRNALSKRAFSRVGGRSLSSPANQITEADISANLVKVEKFKKFVQNPVAPKTFADVLGSGVELHIPKNMAEIAVLSGMPAEQAKRTVLIAPRMTKTVQSGFAQANQWQISWKNSERWSNPLMGWTSTADPLSNLKLNFDSEADAIAFAEKNGWAFETRRPAETSFIEGGTFAYSHNFLPKRTIALLKEQGAKNVIFKSAGAGKSNWFMPLKFHGDGEVEQHGPRGTATAPDAAAAPAAEKKSGGSKKKKAT